MKPHDTTIIIVEDDESMRDTLEVLLKKDYRLIQAVNGEEALEKLKENEIQIALIDIKLPDISGTEILKTIKRERPDIECIVMSAINNAETSAECFKSGALDYFTKEFDYDILRQRIKNAENLYHKKRQIRHLLSKIQMLESEVSKLKSGRTDRGNYPLSNKGADYILTEREIEILKLKNRGLRNKEMAHKLSISPETVKNHINHILHKLSFKSMYQAITFAYEKGILKASKNKV